MKARGFVQLYEFVWMLQSHRQQRLAWQDALEAREARQRSEIRAAIQLKAMLEANPSGALGNASLNELEALKNAGLL